MGNGRMWISYRKEKCPDLYKAEHSELRAVFDVDYDKAVDYAKRNEVIDLINTEKRERWNSLMKCIYLEASGKIEVKEVENPSRKENKALIKVKSIGICGSDVGAYRGANQLVSYSRIIGHEIAGEVVEIGENSKGIKSGDRIINRRMAEAVSEAS